jgi:diguanylate cyclase (GGDEF)-like protein
VTPGLLTVVAGDAVVFDYLNVLRIECPFPSVADALYVGAYPVLTAGLILGASVTLFVLVAARMAAIIGEREALERRLAYQPYHDPLTGLPDRRLFVDRLEHELARAARQGRQVAVLFVDLDDFKPVNDTLGHAAGDHLLVAVGKRLLSCLRLADTAARLGGDEFAILIGNVGDEGRDATAVAERILQALRMPYELEGRETAVGASVGMVLSDGTADRPWDVLRKAELALYRAKSGRKGSCEVFGAAKAGVALSRRVPQAASTLRSNT